MNKKQLAGLVLGVALMTPFGAISAEKTLSGNEIRKVFTNKTLIGDNYGKKITVHIFSGPNGEWWSQRQPPNIMKFGWSVNGNKHCKTEGGKKSCGTIVSRGESNVYYKFLKGKERFKFTIIGDGNKLE